MLYRCERVCVCRRSVQLQGKFEQLKRLHAEEKSALEEKRRTLEEEMSIFNKRKAATELLQAQAFNPSAYNKKDKDRKKWVWSSVSCVTHKTIKN